MGQVDGSLAQSRVIHQSDSVLEAQQLISRRNLPHSAPLGQVDGFLAQSPVTSNWKLSNQLVSCNKLTNPAESSSPFGRKLIHQSDPVLEAQ